MALAGPPMNPAVVALARKAWVEEHTYKPQISWQPPILERPWGLWVVEAAPMLVSAMTSEERRRWTAAHQWVAQANHARRYNLEMPRRYRW